jgi:hypothetical protein
MTTEEFREKYYPEGCRDWMFEEALAEFAELKCKELLEIVAEKAKIKARYSLKQDDGFPTLVNLVDEEPNIDKDSILNAVNLKEFIK